MQKKRWVLEVTNDVLGKHGFTFIENDRRNFWHFEKEEGGITQRIELQDENLFDDSSKKRALTEWICTSAYGSKLPLNMLQFIPKERLPKPIDMLEGLDLEEFNKKAPIKEPMKDLVYWSYEDIDSFKSSLKNLTLLVEEYGLPELARLSVESKIIPTVEMATKLASSHKELSDKFAIENQLETSNGSRENIIKWFDVIEQKMKDTKDDPYKCVQDMLVEITAFLGEQLRKELGGKWKTGVEPRIVSIRNMNIFASTSYSPFKRVIGTWKHQDINYFKEEYLLVMESKLPATQEFMRNYSKRRKELKKFKYPAL